MRKGINIFFPGLFFGMVMVITSPVFVSGQEVDAPENMIRLKIKSDRFFITADTSIYLERDTVLLIPEMTDYMISRVPPLDEALMYRNIYRRSTKNRLFRSLHDMAFVDPVSQLQERKGRATASTAPFIDYEGLIIREIKLKTLEPFGPSVDDTSGRPYTWPGRLGNTVHVNTRSYVLRSNLLISEGELIDPVTLANNELVIRNLPYIDDVKFIVLPVGESDSADILVIAKDKFSLALVPVIKDIQSMSVRVWEENLGGLGHRIEGEMSVQTNRAPIAHFDKGVYRIQNINGSFFSGDMGYEFTDGQDQYTLGFDKRALPPSINTGMGMRYRRYVWNVNYLNEDSLLIPQQLDMEMQNAYISHSLALTGSERHDAASVYLSPGLTLSNRHYLKRPSGNGDVPEEYRNTTLFLGSIGLSRNNTYNSRFFFEYGRTENVPYGFMFNLLGGLEVGERYNRFYSGFSFFAANNFKDAGWIFVGIDYGGYYRENTFEDGVLDLGLNHATNLLRVRNNRVRIFSSLYYTLGINRRFDDYLRFQNNNAIYGFSSSTITGSRRFSLQFQPVVFSPWMLFGFRFAFFAYASVGSLMPDRQSLFDSNIYSGFGIGVRIRNENLVFNALEIRLSFYPNTPADQQSWRFDTGGAISPRFRYFLPDPPHIIYYH
jgi:outer membrane protein assembly factor BamA